MTPILLQRAVLLTALSAAFFLVGCNVAPQRRFEVDGSQAYFRPWQVEAAREAFVQSSLVKLDASGTFKEERQWILDTIALQELNRTEATKTCKRIELMSIERLPLADKSIPVVNGSPKTIKPGWYSENWTFDVCGTKRTILILDDVGQVKILSSLRSPQDGPRPAAICRELWYGVVRNSGHAETASAANPMGTLVPAQELRLVRQTAEVSLKPGLSIGVGFEIDKASNRNAIGYDVVWLYPKELLNSETGQSAMESRAKATCLVGALCTQGWTFDERWKVSPGSWTVQIWLDGQLAMSRTFELSSE